MNDKNMQLAKELLKKHFGYENFRQGQECSNNVFVS